MRPPPSIAPRRARPRLLDALPRRPLVIAHRGVPVDTAENTLGAFEEAIRQGADMIETDVRVTADGVFVLAHDDVLAEREGSARRISLLPARQVTRAVLRRGGGVPTLAMAADALRGRVLLNLDLKTSGVEAALAEELRRLDLTGHVLACTLDRASAAALKRADPALAVSLSYPEPRFTRAVRIGAAPVTLACLGALAATLPGRLVRWLAESGADAATLYHGVVTRRLVAALHAREAPVFAWTVNGAFRARYLLAAGVDGITTDRPGLIAALRAARARDG